MRIFVLEYATGGGILERPGLANCRTEGDAMLRRLVADLADIPGARVDIATDDAMTEVALSGRRVHCHRIASGAPVRSLWEDILAKVDAIWAIAPETAGILADLTAWAEQRGRIVLGSPSQAVKIATSKLATARHLARHDIPVVPTYRFDMTSELPASAAGWVVKPDDGIGGEGARYLATAEDVRRWRSGSGEEFAVVQPFLPGAPISVSMLVQQGVAWILACNIQDIRRDGNGFVYRGGWVGGAEELRPALTPLAAMIAEALPDLWGYIGVDLIATPDGPIVLEINPRLTTSYVGVRNSTGLNPAALVLRLLDTPLPTLIRPLSPRPCRVEVPRA